MCAWVGPQPYSEMRPRWLYFWLFAWFASSSSFGTLLLEDLGLTKIQISLVTSVSTCISIFSSSFMASIAEYLSNRGNKSGKEWVMFICVCLSTIAFISSSLPQQLGIPTQSILSQTIVAALKVVEAAFSLPLHQLINSVTNDFLDEKKNSNQTYGGERLFASISWGLFHVIVGLCMDLSQSSKILYALKTFFAMIFVIILYEYTRKSIGKSKSPYTNNLKPNLTVLQSCLVVVSDLWSFLFVLLFSLICVGKAILSTSAFPFFKHFFGASNITCGLSIAVSVLLEVPILHSSKYLLNKFGSSGMLMAAVSFYCIRVVGYTIIPGGAWLLALESLHGVTFGFSDTAANAFINGISNSETRQKLQLSFYTMSKVITVFGSYTGGVVEDQFDSSAMFRGSAVVMIFFLLLFMLSEYLRKRKIQ